MEWPVFNLIASNDFTMIFFYCKGREVVRGVTGSGGQPSAGAKGINPGIPSQA